MTEEEKLKEVKLDLTTQSQNYQVRLNKCKDTIGIIKEIGTAMKDMDYYATLTFKI